ncbi:MAG: chloride channel protein [Actinomyces sp.]|jgi:CIC family chloride channel protein|nr:chloride channel protein [Actinomyces sp.]MCI1788957.1 chloride channel protein [Actinomyces sp.]MCI1829774.1 chloride channel protein [Actinomyces sp.]MCI1866650.1 chloride channel protein [Actinomyces sp.]
MRSAGTTTTGRGAGSRLVAAVVLGGVAAGLTGWFFQRLLHVLQRLAFGIGPGTGGGPVRAGWLDVRSGPSLLTMVEAADPWRRVAVLAVAGVVGGLSWFLYFRRGHAGVDVAATAEGRPAPLPAAFWHTTTQVVIVAMGASIGREAAPRELAASLSAWLSDRLGLSPEDRRTIVACGAGAGLAAVYSIPLSGAVFALEVVLTRVTPRTVWPALAMSGLAVLVADGWTFGSPFYDVPEIAPTASLAVWALLAGPLIGALGHGFGAAVRRGESSRPRDARLLWTMPVAFTAVGLVSVWVPGVLGNGQSSAQIAFDLPDGAAASGATLLAVAVLAKLATTLATIRSGAWGGTLQPSVALGAGIGALTGMAWGLLWSAVAPGSPGTQLAAFAVIGAAAFLATSWRAPLTALALVMEFTHQGPAILLPCLLAIGGATATARWLALREAAPPPR